MSAAIRNRISRLEGGATPPEHREALVVLHGSERSPDELIGVYGINVPRLASESGATFLARLEAHIRATRPHAMPFVGFAQYAYDVD